MSKKLTASQTEAKAAVTELEAALSKFVGKLSDSDITEREMLRMFDPELCHDAIGRILFARIQAGRRLLAAIKGYK